MTKLWFEWTCLNCAQALLCRCLLLTPSEQVAASIVNWGSTARCQNPPCACSNVQGTALAIFLSNSTLHEQKGRSLKSKDTHSYSHPFHHLTS